MIWWRHLYLGERAAAVRPALLRHIREGARPAEVYVITPPESGNHILDIRPLLLVPEEERGELLVLGLALGYGEACRVARDMIADMYTATGGFDWEAYRRLREGEHSI